LQKVAKLEKEYFDILKQELNKAVKWYMKKMTVFARQLRLLCCSDVRALRIVGEG
jgi:hypothetical protein